MPDLAQVRIDAVASAWSSAADNDEARENLREMMDGDNLIYRAIMHLHEEEAISRAIATKRLATRRVIWNRPSAPDQRVVQLAMANSMTLYDMPLPSGLRLGEATIEDLRAASELWRGRARDMESKAIFMDRIAAKMKAGQKVRKAWKLPDLEALRSAV